MAAAAGSFQALLDSAELGRWDLVREYLRRPDADYQQLNSATNSNEDTFLHIAAGDSELDIVRMLLDNGANVNVKNADGNTSLHIAIGYDVVDPSIEENNINVIKLLIERGADLTAMNNKKESPYNLGVKRRRVRPLVKAGNPVQGGRHKLTRRKSTRRKLARKTRSRRYR